MTPTPAERRAHQRRKVEALRAQLAALEARGDHADAAAVCLILKRVLKADGGPRRWRANTKRPAGRLRAAPYLAPVVLPS